MIKDLSPPTEAEEYRNVAEILPTWRLKCGLAKSATKWSTLRIISIASLHLPSTHQGQGSIQREMSRANCEPCSELHTRLEAAQSGADRLAGDGEVSDPDILRQARLLPKSR
jgi:hypothetical protein